MPKYTTELVELDNCQVILSKQEEVRKRNKRYTPQALNVFCNCQLLSTFKIVIYVKVYN